MQPIHFLKRQTANALHVTTPYCAIRNKHDYQQARLLIGGRTQPPKCAFNCCFIGATALARLS